MHKQMVPTFSELQSVLSEEQKKELMNSWYKKQYLAMEDRSLLSEKINLSDAAVKMWYQNMRNRMTPNRTSEASGKNDSSSKMKEEREAIWDEKKLELMNVFRKQQYVSITDYSSLSKKTNMGVEAMKIWFANMRHELRDKMIKAGLDVNDSPLRIK